RALELELPVAARDPDDEHLIGREGEELMRDLHDQEIERLAEVAEIDPGALRGRLAQIARKAETPEVDPKEGGNFGWGFIKPEAWRVRAALATLAAELVDAGRIEERRAFVITDLWPPFERPLLRGRPGSRPSEMPGLLPFEDRDKSYRWPHHDLTDATSLLIRECDGWEVIGESTHVNLLSHDFPRQVREQAAGDVLDVNIWEPGVRGVSSDDHRNANFPLEARFIQRSTPRLVDSEMTWLAINPVLARS